MSTHESVQLEQVTFEKVQTMLCVAYESGATGERFKAHPAAEILNKFVQAQEEEINGIENGEEASRRRIELTFNLAKLYSEAGFVKEAKNTLLQGMFAALSGHFDEMYWELYDYFVKKLDGTEEEIDTYQGS